IQRLSDLVATLIETTRAEGDSSSMAQESHSLNDVLGEVVEDCKLEAEARGCRFAIQEAYEVIVKGDRELLRRAFENVIRNAIRYSPDGASVDIHADAAARSAHIAVRDYGP